MMLVRLEPEVPWSQVKHSTTEPLRSQYELCRWTSKWLLSFNANKCKVLHIRYKNPRFGYEMTDKNYNTVDIKAVDHEKDLV